MKKITAKYITDNMEGLVLGERIGYRGATYWMVCDDILTADGDFTGKKDAANGTIYWISADRNIAGCINGHEYAKVINGTPYRVEA